MPHDDRNTIEVLKAELNFMDKGGYGRSPRDPWKTVLAFEDSPTCMNYDSKEERNPCAECLLMQFVPADRRGRKSSMPPYSFDSPWRLTAPAISRRDRARDRGDARELAAGNDCKT